MCANVLVMEDTPTTNGGKRTLTFPPKSTTERKHRDTAVAWITAQKGGYQCANVTATIQKDLAKAGFKVDQHLVHYSITSLVREGWAVHEVAGRRTVLFMMDPDVEVPEPGFVTAKKMQDRSDRQQVQSARRPPLPRQNSQAPPWLQDLIKVVTAWWRDTPDEANAWAMAVIEEFES